MNNKREEQEWEETPLNPRPKTADQLAAEFNEQAKAEGTYLEEREGEENEMQVVFLPKNLRKSSEQKPGLPVSLVKRKTTWNEFKAKNFWGKLDDVFGTALDLSFRFFIYIIIAVVAVTIILGFFRYAF